MTKKKTTNTEKPSTAKSELELARRAPEASPPLAACLGEPSYLADLIRRSLSALLIDVVDLTGLVDTETCAVEEIACATRAHVASAVEAVARLEFECFSPTGRSPSISDPCDGWPAVLRSDLNAVFLATRKLHRMVAVEGDGVDLSDDADTEFANAIDTIACMEAIALAALKRVQPEKVA